MRFSQRFHLRKEFHKKILIEVLRTSIRNTEKVPERILEEGVGRSRDRVHGESLGQVSWGVTEEVLGKWNVWRNIEEIPGKTLTGSHKKFLVKFRIET